MPTSRTSRVGRFASAARRLNQGARARARNSYSQKIVDYVLEDRATGTVIALIELDDRSHNSSKDGRRDALTQAAGYRTVRLPAGRVYPAKIAAQLQTALSDNQLPPA